MFFFYPNMLERISAISLHVLLYLVCQRVKHFRDLMTSCHPSLHTFAPPPPNWFQLSNVSICGVPVPRPTPPASPLERFADLLPPAWRLLRPVGPRLGWISPPVVMGRVSPRHEEPCVIRRRGKGRHPSSPRRSRRRRLMSRRRGEEAPVGCHVSMWRSSCTSSSSSLEDAVEEVMQVSWVARTARVLWRHPEEGRRYQSKHTSRTTCPTIQQWKLKHKTL